MNRLVLVRHGETTSNVLRRLDTKLPGARLTDFGARQAALFAVGVEPSGDVVLMSSRARRARETAEIIGAVWGLTNQVIDGVHEVQVGDLEDRFDREAHETFGDVVRRWHEGDLDAELPGGESLRDVYDRYLRAVDDIAAQHFDGTSTDVYLVSHGAVIRLIAARLAGIDSRYAIDSYLSNTGSIEMQRHDDGTWECLRWGGNAAPFVLPDQQPSDPDDPMG